MPVPGRFAGFVGSLQFQFRQDRHIAQEAHRLGIDMSRSGAAIAAENRPPLNSLVLLGKVQARVVRNLEEGFALEFVHEQLAETLEDSVTAR